MDLIKKNFNTFHKNSFEHDFSLKVISLVKFIFIMVSKFKTVLSAFAIVLFLLSCDSNSNSKSIKKPKIAIAGLAIESSTFSPATTDAAAFLAREGVAVFDYYPFLQEGAASETGCKLGSHPAWSCPPWRDRHSQSL